MSTEWAKRLPRFEREPSYVEAYIGLIDALRAIIKIDTAIARDLLQEGGITREEHDKGMVGTKQLMMILQKLEEHGVDPTLNGLVKERQK